MLDTKKIARFIAAKRKQLGLTQADIAGQLKVSFQAVSKWANGCSLVGGETSIQPEVVEKGTYILTASIAGVVSKRQIIDGSAIRAGDVVLAVASNGLHTNGYTLVRILPEGLQARIDLDQVKTLPIFSYIKRTGNIEEQEMLATFNCGVGLILIVGREQAERTIRCIGRYHAVYPVGEICRGERAVDFSGHIDWS